MNKTKGFLLAAGMVFAMAFTLSCSSDGESGGGSSSSEEAGKPSSSSGSMYYKGQSYRTVQIGIQTWMAENLNYEAEGSKCYDNAPAKCAEYGRLYDWATAMALPSSCNTSTCSGQIQSPHQGICPDGWHIPSSEDWGRLSRYVDGTTGPFADYRSLTASKHLKAQSGWEPYSLEVIENLDTYGFSALPGGGSFSNGSFYDVGLGGYWWSAAENISGYAFRRVMQYKDYIAGWNNYGKSNLYSVRCVEDYEEPSSSSSVPSSSSSVHSSSSSALSSSSSIQCSDKGNGTFIDVRNGKTYGYVTICSQTWMAENLNYDVEGSKCYDDDPAKCAEYGRLYDWETAKTVCPTGWHLPSEAEWTTLVNFVGSDAGTKLKATSGWNWNDFEDISGNGTDKYGFSALPGGSGSSDGSFVNVGSSGYWWSATDYLGTAYLLDMHYFYSDVDMSFNGKSNLYSVRCVGD